jgi:hypothetical protein
MEIIFITDAATCWFSDRLDSSSIRLFLAGDVSSLRLVQCPTSEVGYVALAWLQHACKLWIGRVYCCWGFFVIAAKGDHVGVTLLRLQLPFHFIVLIDSPNSNPTLMSKRISHALNR